MSRVTAAFLKVRGEKKKFSDAAPLSQLPFASEHAAQSTARTTHVVPTTTSHHYEHILRSVATIQTEKSTTYYLQG